MAYLARFALGLALPDLPLSVPEWYLPATGLVWGLGGLAAVYGLFRGRPWAPSLVRWGSGMYLLWYWADRLLLARSEYARVSWPAAALLSLAALGLLAWGLRRPAVRAYYREDVA